MNRNEIIRHIELHRTRMGSYAAVARKCGVNQGALSAIIHGKYGADEQRTLARIAERLDYRERRWALSTDVANYRTIARVAADAQQEAMWMAISNKAGSGKTATMEDLYNRDTTGAITFIQCEEWHGRQFLLRLVEKTVGIAALEGKGYYNMARLMDIVVAHFNSLGTLQPLLLIDETDKLRPSALRTLIPLYNRTEGRLGVILSGTENFEKEMRQGVRHHKKGYDELESRFGRTYINLRGAGKADVAAICTANGLLDAAAHEQVWAELDKVAKPTRVRTERGEREVMVDYVEDFRRLNRIVKRALLQQRTETNPLTQTNA